MIYSTSTANLITNTETAQMNFPLLKEAGFDAVDLNIDVVFNRTGGAAYSVPKHSTLFDLPEEEVIEYFKGIKEAAEANGIKIAQTHAPFPSYRVGKEEDFNDYLTEVIRKSIAVNGYLGCPYIVIHPVVPDYGNTFTKEEIYRMNVDFYARFIPELKKHGVTACLESMWVKNKTKIYAAPCNDFEEVNRYIDELNGMAGEELFGFCLDTGHVVITSGNLREAIRTVGKNIKVLHLHDVDGVNDNHTMPYVGITDWDMIMTELKNIGYEGTLNFEAGNAWLMFPEPLRPDAIKMLGRIGNYFAEKYFNCADI